MQNKDRQSLLGILESIEKNQICITPFKNADEFFADKIRFDAAMMNFVVIGEMVDKISVKEKSRSEVIDWVKIKDFRNLIAHDYFGIDAEEVWQIANTHIKKLLK